MQYLRETGFYDTGVFFLKYETRTTPSPNVMVHMSAISERCSYTRGMMVLLHSGFLFEIYPLPSFTLVIC